MIIGAVTINATLILNIIRLLIDVSLVWFVAYLILSAFSNNMRSMQIIKGVLMILMVKFFTMVFSLTTLDYVVNAILTWGVVAVIIIFQPEIRLILEKIGRTDLDYSLSNLSNDEKEKAINELVDAISRLSQTQTGALITFERSQSLIDYINTGTKINADIKSELFTTIFWEGTPLHDGAVIIKGDRVVCAAAFFPTTSQELSPLYGARHRAAIGISEVTDALTIVVSEETGTISFVENGKMRKVQRKELKASLVNSIGWFTNEKVGDNRE